MSRYLIDNVKVALKDGVLENGKVYIKDGFIERVEESGKISCGRYDGYYVDGKGKWLIPGLIDLGSNVLETRVSATKNVKNFSITSALFSLERRLLWYGVTSVYHNFTLIKNDCKRNHQLTSISLEDINRIKEYGFIRHNVNLEYNVSDKNFSALLVDIIEKKNIQLLTLEDLLSENKYDQVVQFVDLIIEKILKHKIPTTYKINTPYTPLNYNGKLVIPAFSVIKGVKNQNIYSVTSGIDLMMSHESEILSLIHNSYDNIISSASLPSSIVNSIFMLHNKYNIPIYKLINMASINPAVALGIDGKFGSIESGKYGDVVLVDEVEGEPFVEQVFVKGKKICGNPMNYSQDIGSVLSYMTLNS